MSDLTDVGPRDEDIQLLTEIGLKKEGWVFHDWTDLGMVVVRQEDDERIPSIPASEVRVEVYACSAQFFRFTILRPQDSSNPVPRERIRFITGSGSLRDYWPTAKLIAENRLTVKEIDGFEGDRK